MLDVARKYETTIHLRPTIYTGNAKHNSLKRNDLRLDLLPYLSDKNVRNGLLFTKKTIPTAKYYGCEINKDTDETICGGYCRFSRSYNKGIKDE